MPTKARPARRRSARNPRTAPRRAAGWWDAECPPRTTALCRPRSRAPRPWCAGLGRTRRVERPLRAALGTATALRSTSARPQDRCTDRVEILVPSCAARRAATAWSDRSASPACADRRDRAATVSRRFRHWPYPPIPRDERPKPHEFGTASHLRRPKVCGTRGIDILLRRYLPFLTQVERRDVNDDGFGDTRPVPLVKSSRSDC